MSNAHTASRPSLKRIAPGAYETRDGKWEVTRCYHPHDDSSWWYFRCTVPGHELDEAHDLFETKRAAVEALAALMDEFPA